MLIIWVTAATAAQATSSGNTPSSDVIFRNSTGSHSMSRRCIVGSLWKWEYRSDFAEAYAFYYTDIETTVDLFFPIYQC